ncbi:MAG: hypothetical protein QHH24_07815, partial [Candidatus Bathyarchaeota archaeon]|nr:hypothetical protein [Candidatus Bathyarchaeota archaeon]
EFYYTPGHTVDSCSCFDHADRVLFVGDNVELPIPYVNELNFASYVATLEEYLERNAEFIVSGHADVADDYALLRINLDYVKSLGTLSVDNSSLDKKGKIMHFRNLTNIGAKLREKNLIKEALQHYRESERVLEKMDDNVQGKWEQLKQVREIITSLTER